MPLHDMSSLADHFEGATGKRLSAVEADPEKSHQHEFNGVKGLLKLFGKRAYGDRKVFHATFIALEDEEELCLKEEGELTWYESREAPRSEHRLYYRSSAVTERLEEGDPIVFARIKGSEKIMVITAKKGSTAEHQLLWLFSLSPDNLEKVEYRDFDNQTANLGFADKLILESIGIESIIPDEKPLEEMLQKFNRMLPTTREFSDYARSKISADPRGNPDTALTQWLEKEEALFRAFEKHLVGIKLKEGFKDVEEFLWFSKSIGQRRMSRMGHSFENHLAEIFSLNSIRFSKGKYTEKKSKPDFVFPGISEYHDAAFPGEKLTMLGAKSTCKDRWPLICLEADRIRIKHLITLEPGITESQTDKMNTANLQLVVPVAVQQSYTEKQRKWLLSLNDFISLLSTRQN